MKPEEIRTLRQSLPTEMAYPYFPDRESAWVLAQCMPDATLIKTLRKSALAKLLDRPILRPVVARCGGVLHRSDVMAVAHADRAGHMPDVTTAGLAGIEQVFAQPWHDFLLTFTSWGNGQYWDQTTRRQRNLVVQMGFPTDHSDLMGRYLSTETRKTYEEDVHPIRTKGRPTLAWARLDIDIASGEALIEEVQSDWLRFACDRVEALRIHKPRSRQLAAAERYEAGLVARYGRIWPRAIMLAVLMLLRNEFAIRTVWMHQPDPGAALKRINGQQPPRSLYTSLPKSMCFSPTRARPEFLRGLPARVTKQLPRTGPLFWQLDFS